MVPASAASELDTRILIVDDDIDVCETFRDILEMEGYCVTMAHNGNDALAATDDCDFDAVLMDIKMPGMDGVETFAHLHERCPEIPVIMLSAYALHDRIAEALRLGAYAALHKPVGIRKLLDTLAAVQAS